ncbi:MAG: endonuclease III domain-containing protein, partial [ANME-2 cluster archaeon]
MNLTEVYEKLLSVLGHQHWWPADTPFEVAVGALLTQQTRWKNVECAISNLK